ncbi:unnamed protein product [Prorocentrum cordatum]|uniref:Uncharacterized protein n=1 Tax=Prorocentrum cordatum TaxID=2364126 RepID=A0ABN9WEV2_9DINO|nr:unnamed protein product [Polarella glacialis]
MSGHTVAACNAHKESSASPKHHQLLRHTCHSYHTTYCRDMLVQASIASRCICAPSLLARRLAMPLAIQLVVLDDLKGIQRIAMGQRKVGSPPGLASIAGLQAGEFDSPAQQNPAVGAAAGTAARAVAERDWDGQWVTVGSTLRSAIRTHVGGLLRRSLY